jgi:osmoprotectant transport system ATP-binding protein
MIQLQQVSKYYGEAKAVEDISLDVQEGETIALLGTSGCGKTTTLRMVNRLTDTSKGEILINNQNIKDQQPEQLRRSIGYVLQHTGLFPHYTIADNIATVPKLLGWTKTKINSRVETLLQKLHLPPGEFINKYPRELSGGQQQRIGLARALAADPPILLMDEPFGALDPVTRTSIRQEFLQLDELKQKTIVIVTHDVQEAFELADRICLMDKGRIIQTGKPTDLLFKPANDLVSSFLSDQQFLLELQSITLFDVWDYLGNTQKTFTYNELDGTQSIWQALQAINNATTSDHYYVQKNGQVKVLQATAIMDAFYQYKTSRHE